VIDISGLGFQFRGYPVTVASYGVMAMLRDPSRDVGREIARILREAKEMGAGPEEPSGWMFRSQIGHTPVYLERFGGIRDVDAGRHEDGQWSLFLSSER
jgi:hypothetical protein